MSRVTIDSIAKAVRRLKFADIKKIIYLLFSGFFSSLVILAISLNLWEPFARKEESNQFLMMLVIYGFLLTILKLGSDSYVFSKVRSEHNLNCVFDINFKKSIGVLFVLLLLILVLFFDYTVFQIFVLLLAAVVDVFSLRNSAHLSARKKYDLLMFVNISNYFFFFVVLLVYSQFMVVPLNLAMCFFLVASIFRFCLSRFLLNMSVEKERAKTYLISISPLMLLFQQILNYTLAKVDQLTVSSQMFSMSNSGFSAFLSVSKSVDIVVAVQLSLMPLFIAKLYDIFHQIKKIALVFIVVLLLCYLFNIVFFTFFQIYRGWERYISVIFVSMNASLSLFVNVFTYGFLRDDRISELVFILAVSSACAFLLLSGVAVGNAKDYLIYACVPVGQTLFVILSFRRLARV